MRVELFNTSIKSEPDGAEVKTEANETEDRLSSEVDRILETEDVFKILNIQESSFLENMALERTDPVAPERTDPVVPERTPEIRRIRRTETVKVKNICPYTNIFFIFVSLILLSTLTFIINFKTFSLNS